MQRPTLWLMLVVLLLGILFLREPRLEQSEEFFLRWLLKNSDPHGPVAPLTVVEIGHDNLMERDAPRETPETSPHAGGSVVSPLEFALFLQSVLEFQPTVVAFENVLKWRDRDKDQEQVFIDQAMRVPRLLLAAELTTTPDLDAPGPEIQGFTQVTGRRGDLVEFSGIGRQPNEEMRLIATAGFVNLPEEIADGIHVPLLFRYRGEVIPSFAFEAILLWLRVTPAEVTINLDSHIALPQGRKIPIRSDGTLLISPNAGKKVHRIALSDLLLGAQQRDSGQKKNPELDSMREHIVLARTPANPLSPPDVFAATIATIQTNAYVRRVSWIFDCVILLLAAAVVAKLRDLSRVDLVLGAIAFTAAYCLIALAIISRWLIWLPGCLPLGAVWLLVLISIVIPHRYRASRELIAMSPPIPVIEQIEARIARLHRHGLVDLHFDLPMDLYEKRGRKNVLATDFLSDLVAGDIGIAGVALYIDDRYLPEMALRVALDQIARLYEEVDQSERFAICKSRQDILQARSKNKIALLITMEGVEPLGTDLDLLRAFYELGLRSLCLTHMRRNAAGDGAVFAASGSPDDGLTAFGRDLVRECERLGVIVDLAHISPAGFNEIFKITTRPLIVSHTNARRYYDIERNLSDEQIKRVGERGGVIGINAVLVSPHKAEATVDRYIDHIEHVRDVIGIDGVAIGFDFFEFIYRQWSTEEQAAFQKKFTHAHFVPELSNHSQSRALTRRLIERGYSDEEIERILFRNWMRMFEDWL